MFFFVSAQTYQSHKHKWFHPPGNWEVYGLEIGVGVLERDVERERDGERERERMREGKRERRRANERGGEREREGERERKNEKTLNFE